MEGRMTLCNMAIEAGARVGLIAVDDKTIEYVRGRPLAPTGARWEQAVANWKQLRSDPDAHFDKLLEIDAATIEPQVSWGTSPEMVLPIGGRIPDPAAEPDLTRRESITRALKYMGLKPNQPITEIQLDRVFIGSCPNSPLEDFPAAAAGGQA